VSVMTNWVPGAFHFARSDQHSDGKPTVVQVSTIFGKDPEYWTLVTVGSEQHFMIADFDLLSHNPNSFETRQAAE
jgi:hypothetical protein